MFVSHVPPPALRPYVAQALGYRVPPSRSGVHRGLPYRYLTLVVELARPLVVSSSTSSVRAHTVVGGLYTSAVHIDASHAQDGVQYALTPLAAVALLGVPGGALGSTVADLADVCGPAAREVAERMGPAPWSERFRLLDELLLARLAVGRDMPPQPEVLQAWEVICRSGGQARIGDVARRVGWSRRHLGERFRAAVGVTPKEAGRIVRFERARAHLLTGAPALADVAVTCGYSDQQHLAREWRSLAGCSISEWRRDELPFLHDDDPVGDAASVP